MAEDRAEDRAGPEDALAHLQSAAREMIAAARALLDLAEELVEDPRTVGAVVSAVTTLGKAAARTAARPGEHGPDGEGDGGVQHIPVS